MIAAQQSPAGVSGCSGFVSHIKLELLARGSGRSFSNRLLSLPDKEGLGFYFSIRAQMAQLFPVK